MQDVMSLIRTGVHTWRGRMELKMSPHQSNHLEAHSRTRRNDATPACWPDKAKLPDRPMRLGYMMMLPPLTTPRRMFISAAICGLVNKSAELPGPRTFATVTLPAFTASWHYKNITSRRRILPRPALLANVTAAEESAHICSAKVQPRSRDTACIPRTSAASLTLVCVARLRRWVSRWWPA